MAETELSSKYRFVRIYVYFMFSFYPLFFHNYYFDIATCKYILFLIVTGIVFVVSVFNMPEHLLTQIKERRIRIRISDYFALGILTVNILSVIFSDNKMYGITGADGRFVGLSTVVCLVFLYFLISRTFIVTETFYMVVAIGSGLVSLLGILNSVNVDLLGFYNGLEYSQKLFYISTLGHVDVYTSYFALTIPIIFICYLKVKDNKKRLVYLISLIMNIAAVVGGQCDSGYIVLFASVFLVLILAGTGIKAHLFLLPLAMSEILVKILLEINENLEEPRAVSRFTNVVFGDKVSTIIVVLFAISVFVNLRYKADLSKVKIVFICIFAAVPVTYIIALLVFTLICKNKDLGQYENLLRFSDSFGSYRGYIWTTLVKDFKEMPLLHKLFGIGADSLRPYLVSKYGREMYVVTNAYYDNAHNEFLQYLVTTGILGLMAYMGWLAANIKTALRNPKFTVLLAAIICYLIQSVVNINQVITTPLFIIMISCLGESQRS